MKRGTRTLITGGARSGKSRLGMDAARSLGGNRLFIATAEAGDEEMEERIRKHQEDRGPHWRTVEAPYDLPDAVAEHAPHYDVLLVDCLTLWISNIYLRDGAEAAKAAITDFYETLFIELPAHIVVVTNEVGAGVVPANALSREWRDLVGRANQAVAAACDHVILSCCGLPLYLKKNGAPCHFVPPEPEQT